MLVGRLAFLVSPVGLPSSMISLGSEPPAAKTATQPFEQFHFRSPRYRALRSDPVRSEQPSRFSCQGWVKSNEQRGPNGSSEIIWTPPTLMLIALAPVTVPVFLDELGRHHSRWPSLRKTPMLVQNSLGGFSSREQAAAGKPASV